MDLVKYFQIVIFWMNYEFLSGVSNILLTAALRPAIESLIINAANDPETMSNPNAQDEKTIQVHLLSNLLT